MDVEDYMRLLEAKGVSEDQEIVLSAGGYHLMLRLGEFKAEWNKYKIY